jgi:hypothetical protein
MTVSPKSLPKGSSRRKPAARGRNKMTADEERAIAEAYKETKEGKVRTFRNADEYLKYLDTV